jgi:hypothetical protein
MEFPQAELVRTMETLLASQSERKIWRSRRSRLIRDTRNDIASFSQRTFHQRRGYFPGAANEKLRRV